VWRDAVQQRGNRTTRRQRTHNSQHDTRYRDTQRLSHDKLEDFTPPSSERDPNAHLLDALRHQVAQNAI